MGDDDLAFLRDLYASTRAAELEPLPWPPQAKRAFLDQQFGAQHKYYQEVYKDADFLVIQLDGAAIGRIYVHRAGAQICVVDIALLPAYCGRGIGSALLQEVLDEARAGNLGVNLHVEPNNPAQRLYQRLGFRLIERRGVYDYLEWSPETDAS